MVLELELPLLPEVHLSIAAKLQVVWDDCSARSMNGDALPMCTIRCCCISCKLRWMLWSMRSRSLPLYSFQRFPPLTLLLDQGVALVAELSFSDFILVWLVTPIVRAFTSDLGATGSGSLCCVLASCHLGNYILFTFCIFFDFQSGSHSTSFLLVKWCCCWVVTVFFRSGLLLSSWGTRWLFVSANNCWVLWIARKSASVSVDAYVHVHVFIYSCWTRPSNGLNEASNIRVQQLWSSLNIS